MISALISFFGGSVFRMLWGEISHWMTAKQDHSFELERMRLQEEIDAAQHARNLEAMRLQSDMGIRVIREKADAQIDQMEADAWSKLVESTTKKTGINFIDIWSGSIRPLLATLAILAVVAQIATAGFVLTDWDKELIGGILGIYIADRSLARRGK